MCFLLLNCLVRTRRLGGVERAREILALTRFADRGAVLGFDRGIVVGLAGTGLGLLNAELFDEFGRRYVELLEAVVAVMASDGVRKGADK